MSILGDVRMRRALGSIAALSLVATAPALAQAAEPARPISVVSQDVVAAQPGQKGFLLHSDRLGRDFQILVHMPSATPFLPGQKFPVIYALDGGYGVAGSQSFMLGATGAMAPAIVVEIGYPPAEAVNRNLDLTFVKVTQDGTTYGGGGAAFEAFLAEDLRPFVEARFPIDPQRSVLFGHSFGGLFAARAFADHPDAYAGYIMASVSVWADPGLVAAVAEAASKAKAARIYLTVGGLENPARMVDGFKALAVALKNRPGIILKTQTYAGETHLSYYSRLANDGFPFVLPPIRPLDFHDEPLPPAAVAKYVGVYGLPDGRTLTIRAPQGPADAPPMLQAAVTGLQPAPLVEAGKDRFYAPSADIEATFDGAGLTMVGDGAKLRVEKVEAAPKP